MCSVGAGMSMETLPSAATANDFAFADAAATDVAGGGVATAALVAAGDVVVGFESSFLSHPTASKAAVSVIAKRVIG